MRAAVHDGLLSCVLIATLTALLVRAITEKVDGNRRSNLRDYCQATFNLKFSRREREGLLKSYSEGNILWLTL